MKKRNSPAFAARIANGSRTNRAAGFAVIAIIPNIFTTAVLRAGILLQPKAFVRAALTDGFGHRVCAVRNGRGMKIGMKKKID